MNIVGSESAKPIDLHIGDNQLCQTGEIWVRQSLQQMPTAGGI